MNKIKRKNKNKLVGIDSGGWVLNLGVNSGWPRNTAIDIGLQMLHTHGPDSSSHALHHCTRKK